MDFNVDVNIKTNGKEDVDALEKQINNLKNETVKINVDIGGNGVDFSKLFSNLEKQAQTAGQNISKSFSKGFNFSSSSTNGFNSYKKGLENTAKQISNIQKNILNGAYDAKSSTFSSKLSSYRNQSNNALIKQAKEQAKLYDDTLTNLKKHFDSKDTFRLNDEEVVKSFDTMTNAAKKFDNTMTQIKNTQSKDLGLGVAERSANNVKAYYESNTKALKKYGAELKNLESRYRSIKTEGEKLDLDNQFKNLKSKISAEGLTGKSWIDEIGRGFKKIGQFALTYGAIQRIPNKINQMYQEVVKVDTAMTELRKVSDVSDLQITNYFSEATTMAKEYGRTISDIINSTADWSRLGYSLPDSKELARVTSLYQNVGDSMTQESASESLISTLQGFQLNANEAESIVDKFNEVANNYAIDTAGIGEALQRSAASFNAANTDLSKSIALITGTNEVVQNPESVGKHILPTIVVIQ